MTPRFDVRFIDTNPSDPIVAVSRPAATVSPFAVVKAGQLT